MNGCIIPYTPIAVDFWKVRQCPRVQIFFLSHAHLEPTCGITSSWSLPIYCSAISKKLLIHQFQLNADVIHELELGVPTSIFLTPAGDVTMTVTLIDANHCPGSVMFLFDGYFGHILYTGDFRYSDSMLKSLTNELLKSPIDVLYLDNTFCSPKCAFPRHDEALKSIIEIVEEHPNNRVMFGMRNLGKEDMLISVSEYFNERIAVTLERYKVLELLGMQQRFVVCTEERETQPRFEVVSLVEVTRSNVDTWNKFAPTIAILPTALFEGLGFQPFISSSDIFVVPYSDHSPFAELQQFVSGIRPKSVIPIVRADVSARDDPLAESLLDRANVECFADCLDRTPMQNYHIPASVLEMMNQNSIGTGNLKKRNVNNGGSRRHKSKQAVSTKSASLQRTLSVSSDNLESCEMLSINDKSTAAVSRDRQHATHVPPKPHVLVRPMRRCSSSDRLLALAIRPAQSILKQRLSRLSAGISNSSTPSIQSNVRPRSGITTFSPVLGLARARRDRPMLVPHRIARCQGNIACSHPVQHPMEKKIPTDTSSQATVVDTPLNLSQSAKQQESTSISNMFVTPSNSGFEPQINRDYLTYHVTEPIVNSTPLVTVCESTTRSCDCAAIAVSSLLSLSNVLPYSYVPTSVNDGGSLITSLLSSTKSLQNEIVGQHMEMADMGSSIKDMLIDFQLQNQVNNSETQVEAVGTAHFESSSLASVRVDSNKTQHRLSIFLDGSNGIMTELTTINRVESTSNDEPHDYSTTSTTITDSFEPVTSNRNVSDEHVVCSASFSNVSSETITTVSSVTSQPYHQSSTTVMLETDSQSNSSDAILSSVGCEFSEGTLLPTSDSLAGAGGCGVASVMLPPKKNWRRRYHRSSQLHRAHQENKRCNLLVVGDSELSEGRCSPAIKRLMSRGRSDTLFNAGCVADMPSFDGVSHDCEGMRPAKRAPLIASHSLLHHSGVEVVVEKSVLKSNPANMKRDVLIIDDDVAKHIGYLPSTGLLESPVKRVTRYIRDEISICKPAVVNKHSVSGCGSLLPLDLSAYPMDSNNEYTDKKA